MSGNNKETYQVVLVKPQRRWLQASIIALVSIALFGGGLVVGGGVSLDAVTANEALETKVAELSSEVFELQNKIVEADLSVDVQRQTLAELKKELEQQHVVNEDLTAEVLFYRDLVSNTDGSAGKMIAVNLVLSPSALIEGRYRYVLTLAGPTSNRAKRSGSIQWRILGNQNGTSTSIGWEDIAMQSSGESLLFQFRYFQDISGEIVIPVGFNPTAHSITLIGKDGPPVDYSFDWKLVETINTDSLKGEVAAGC